MSRNTWITTAILQAALTFYAYHRGWERCGGPLAFAAALVLAFLASVTWYEWLQTHNKAFPQSVPLLLTASVGGFGTAILSGFINPFSIVSAGAICFGMTLATTQYISCRPNHRRAILRLIPAEVALMIFVALPGIVRVIVSN